MLHPRGGIFKSLFEPQNQEEDTDIDLEQVKEDILEKFGEAVKTPDSEGDLLTENFHVAQVPAGNGL